MNTLSIPAGYIASGYKATVEGRPGSVPTTTGELFFTCSDSEDVYSLKMTPDTMSSLLAYLQGNAG